MPGPRGQLWHGPYLEALEGYSETMKLCPHCSKSLEDDTVKCARCGKWIVPKREVAGSKKKKGRRGGWMRLAFLGLLVVAAAAVWAMPDGPVNPREFLDLQPFRNRVVRTMRSDLESLVTRQESYFDAHDSYSGNLSALSFRASEGVNISLVVTPMGWSATATHEDHPGPIGCAVFSGSATPPHLPVVPSEPGKVACTGHT